MDEARPSRENSAASRAGVSVPMRSVRVAGTGARSTARGGERRPARAVRDAPAGQRPWGGPRRPPSQAAPTLAEREAERRRGKPLGQVAQPFLHTSATPLWVVGGALAVLLLGEVARLLIGRPLGPWRELCL